MKLIVVESPTKIKTLRKILDGSWKFVATAGHLYDLPEDEMGVGEDYEPDWVPLPRGQNKKTISKLRKLGSSADKIYLATDPDREGEAIAWQVDELILNSNQPAERIRLEGLTEDNVNAELNSPDSLDQKMVSAQWARRILDRLAGYRISPFLMNAFKGKKLSAGRVQSAVLDRIVDRWQSVEEFEPEEFFRVLLDLQPKSGEVDPPLEAELFEVEGKAVGTDDEEKLLKDEAKVKKIEQAVREDGLEIDARKNYRSTTNPAPPFNNSELLRRASSWFNWPSGKTMNVAQSLYEKGLITYHRSDSTRLSRDGCRQAAGYIRDEFGKQAHQWRQGGSGDQEGHEAIRAQYAGLEPDELHSVSSNERTLYAAIWQRYIQSQMKPARWQNLKLILSPVAEVDARFEGKIRTIEEPGFFQCQRPGETPAHEKEHPAEALKKFESGEVQMEDLRVESSETRGPRLYTEGSLIAMMKEEGIGRPSTYAATIKKLRSRQYIKVENKNIIPTPRGRDVINFLRRALPAICDVELTREMEDELDQIAEAELDWKQFVESFDSRLDSWLEKAEGLEPEGNAETEKEQLGYAGCPDCGGDLVLREGSYGEFVHCESEGCDFSSNPPAKTYKCPRCDRHMVKKKGNKSAIYHCLAHPDCQGRRPVGKPDMTYEEMQEQIENCPECGSEMERRKGRYGYFWGCSQYPECKGTRQE